MQTTFYLNVNETKTTFRAENAANKQSADGSEGLQELKINEEELPTTPQQSDKISPTVHMSSSHNPFISSVSSTSPQKRELVPSSVSWHPTAVDRPSSQLAHEFKFHGEERDQMMEEATKVVEPGKVLPDRMMGGTPTGGHGFFPSAPSSLGRRRHKSEGTHLRQNRQSYFDEELNVGEGCPVVGSNLDPNDEAELGFQAASPPAALNSDMTQLASDMQLQTDSVFSSPAPNDHMHFQPIQQAEERAQQQNVPQNLSVQQASGVNPQQVAKPVSQPQVSENRLMKPPAQPCFNRMRLDNLNRRQRRHSADNRLFNANSVRGGQHVPPKHQVLMFNSSKNFRSKEDGRKARGSRPPPLHIPSSVSNLSSGGSRMYSSNLHQRIRKLVFDIFKVLLLPLLKLKSSPFAFGKT